MHSGAAAGHKDEQNEQKVVVVADRGRWKDCTHACMAQKMPCTAGKGLKKNTSLTEQGSGKVFKDLRQLQEHRLCQQYDLCTCQPPPSGPRNSKAISMLLCLFTATFVKALNHAVVENFASSYSNGMSFLNAHLQAYCCVSLCIKHKLPAPCSTTHHRSCSNELLACRFQ